MSVATKYERVYIKGKGSVLEHRAIMEQVLGRELLNEEQIHHRDKDKGNNDPSNLELMPDAQAHAEEHAYGEEGLLEFLFMFNNEYGHWPTYQECVLDIAMPHPSTFARVFGSWKKAKQRAQYELDLINEEW